MNREIKFRAWDKKPKVMFAIDKEQSIAGHDFFYNDRFIPMQYTGLKDINGNEVYDKDVVQLGKFRGQVEFRNGPYWVNWTDNTSTKLFAEIQGSKVIGNIYENPELLK